jgi:hypothetical protein
MTANRGEPQRRRGHREHGEEEKKSDGTEFLLIFFLCVLRVLCASAVLPGFVRCDADE